jgi:hypothetical protein
LVRDDRCGDQADQPRCKAGRHAQPQEEGFRDDPARKSPCPCVIDCTPTASFLSICPDTLRTPHVPMTETLITAAMLILTGIHHARHARSRLGRPRDEVGPQDQDQRWSMQGRLVCGCQFIMRRVVLGRGRGVAVWTRSAVGVWESSCRSHGMHIWKRVYGRG